MPICCRGTKAQPAAPTKTQAAAASPDRGRFRSANSPKSMKLKPCLQCINIRIHASLLYPFASHSARLCRTVEAASSGNLLQNGFKFLTYQNLGLPSRIPQHFVQCCNLGIFGHLCALPTSASRIPHLGTFMQCCPPPSHWLRCHLLPSLSLSLSLACSLSLSPLNTPPSLVSALRAVLSPSPDPIVHLCPQQFVRCCNFVTSPLPASLISALCAMLFPPRFPFSYESTLCNAIVTTLPPALPPQHLCSALSTCSALSPPSLPLSHISTCAVLTPPSFVRCCRHPLTPPLTSALLNPCARPAVLICVVVELKPGQPHDMGFVLGLDFRA